MDQWRMYDMAEGIFRNTKKKKKPGKNILTNFWSNTYLILRVNVKKKYCIIKTDQAI